MKKLRRLACRFDLDQSERKSLQVNASAREPWPNGVARRHKSTCDFVWPGLQSYYTSFTRKLPKLRFLFVLRSVNSFAMSMVESLPILSSCMFKTVRLLNCSWIILQRSHLFSLRAVEKDLSPTALVAGFTRISLHNVITSFIISRSGLGSSNCYYDFVKTKIVTILQQHF